FYTARTFFRWGPRFVFFRRTKLNAPFNLEGKLIQLSRIEPKTAALLTGVVGQLSLFRGHIIIDQLNLTVQALHTRSLLPSVLHRQNNSSTRLVSFSRARSDSYGRRIRPPAFFARSGSAPARKCNVSSRRPKESPLSNAFLSHTSRKRS